jgi:alkylation response protein AidB-like acyl-CoA dehydrogenase
MVRWKSSAISNRLLTVEPRPSESEPASTPQKVVHVPRQEEALRTEILFWLSEHWDPELSLVEWRRLLVESGWGVAGWPAEYGGLNLPPHLANLVDEILETEGVPGTPDAVGMHLAVPTLLEHGSEELRRRFLLPSATGEIVWCQLFSEPGAGSDLAGLTTRATLDGEEWTVIGQKVWNTGAAHADYGLLLARTNWDAPKHRGITYFVLPMHQDAIDVRPLRQMNGHASFNEVFIDAARVPSNFLIGALNAGWSGALTTLAHERRLAPSRRRRVQRDPQGRVWQQATQEQRAASEPYKWYPQRAGRTDLLMSRATASGRDGDPLVRSEIAHVLSLARSAQWTAERAAAARVAGRPPGPEGSIGKLASSVIARAASQCHSSIAGASGMLAGASAPTDGLITEILVSVPAQSIAGGTDQIQRNILAERILGLPKDQSHDRGQSFREVPQNA